MLAITIALFFALPPATADDLVVVGAVEFASVSRIESAACDLYAALGMQGVFDRTWVAADCAAAWPAGDLSGIDRTAPIGMYFVMDAFGSVSVAPFAHVVDPRGFDTALFASGWRRDLGEDGRIFRADGTLAERYLFELPSGATVVAPSSGAIAAVRDAALPASFEDDPDAWDVRVRLDVATALPRLEPMIHATLDLAMSWSRLRTLFAPPRPSPASAASAGPAEILSHGVPAALALLRDWRTVEVDVAFRADSVALRARITMQPDSRFAAFVRTMHDVALPSLVPLPEGVALALASTGDAPLLAEALVAAHALEDGSDPIERLGASEDPIFLLVRGHGTDGARCTLDAERPAVAGALAAARVVLAPWRLFGAAEPPAAERCIVSAAAHAQGEALVVDGVLQHAALRALVPEVRVK